VRPRRPSPRPSVASCENCDDERQGDEMDFQLSDEQKLIQETAREFAD
jgi:hypothetical protein